ncbi:unnamed protein product [Brassicogethes aeneus]|uniref:Glucose-methanol-choline oxidoreductase N-terminal domain-containing protein n=1 Tax=Brassicogethes aeneus TaxID=1431903 RepID=A0A9P0FLQ6_BRAAE|nr:unnamed protein product [Brassicogethes aeneus]
MNQTIRLDISPISGPVANCFVLLISALFYNINLIGRKEKYPEDSSKLLLNKSLEVFDFIIVGGGAAGCALTNKLSVIKKWNILLLEAGDYPSSTTEIPGFYGTLPFSEEDWVFHLEKESKSCLGKKNKNCTLTRGKVLGGTSAINNLIYVRGIPEHVNQWNFPEWNSTIVQEIMHLMEGVKKENISSPDIGTEGEIELKVFDYKDHFKEVLIGSYKEHGYDNSDKREYIRLTESLVYSKNGERFNMAEAFLSPIKNKANVYLAVNSEVQKINLANKDNRTRSLDVKIKGKVVTIRARKEIILTAGAVNNAKILLLSGIGPRKDLEKNKVPVVNDLPGVGKNLQLHLNVPLFVAVTRCNTTSENTTECNPDVYSKEFYFRDIFNFIMNRRGNLSTIDINDVVVYMYTKKRGGMYPNIGIYHNYFRINDTNMDNLLRNFQFNSKIENSLRNVNKNRSILLFSISLLRPLSSGEVKLNDKNIYENPKITTNFLTAHEDMNTLVDGFKTIREMIEGYGMTSQNASILYLDIPNCRRMNHTSEKYIKCYISNMAYPITDTAGTTKMGYPCDKKMVVDKVLEVRGIRCLRVGDSSVLPNITVASSIATDIMLGFRLTEILKSKWLKGYLSNYTIDTQTEFTRCVIQKEDIWMRKASGNYSIDLLKQEVYIIKNKKEQNLLLMRKNEFLVLLTATEYPIISQKDIGEATGITERSHRWYLNVSGGIVGGYVVGPYFFDGHLNGPMYLNFLENVLPGFQQDGAPAHFSRDVRAYLDGIFPNQWIGRNGPSRWPARSPDLTIPDFFLWG